MNKMAYMHIAYLQLVNNLAPLVFGQAGGCGHLVVLPERRAPRVQFLQVTLTERGQVRINALVTRPLHKEKQCFSEITNPS